MKNMLTCIVAFLAIASCAPKLEVAQDTGKGKIIVLCTTVFENKDLSVPVVLDSRLIASLTPGSYCEMEANNGQHSLQAGDGDPAQQVVPLRVDVNVHAGNVKYFEVIPQDIAAPGIMTFKEVSSANASAKMKGLHKAN